MTTQYKCYHYLESHTDYGIFGLRILLADLGRDPTPEETQAFYKAEHEIMEVVMAETVRLNPEAIDRAAKEKKELLGLFGERSIFVAELPNGYCSQWCCKHRPWFEVIAAAGPIKIGWRKRVIQISWESGATAQELFAEEDTTKSERMIHAWGIEKAKQYVNRIVESCAP